MEVRPQLEINSFGIYFLCLPRNRSKDNFDSFCQNDTQTRKHKQVKN